MELQNLTKRIKDSFKKDYQLVEVELESKSEKVDGFIGEVNFFKVNCEKTNGKKDIIHVVVKTGKRNPVYRKFVNTENLFKREVTTYDEIFPLFEKFQIERGLNRTIPFPKCHYTLINEDIEMIMLENLKTAGYDINNKKTPLNKAHLEVVLKFYAEFHAVSLAMQDQKNEKFDKLIKTLDDRMRVHLHGPMLPITKKMLEKLEVTFMERNDMNLSLFVRQLIEDDKFEDFYNLFDIKLPYTVITHGDAWNNNIMYKYEDNKVPVQVRILDWQMTSVRNSPVYDILQLLYTSCSPKDLFHNWKDYLKMYHDFLSNYMIKLGSDPNIFTFSTLLNHWKRLSLYGIMFVPMTVKFMYLGPEDVEDFDEMSDIEDTKTKVINAIIKDENYYERIAGLFRFYHAQISEEADHYFI